MKFEIIEIEELSGPGAKIYSVIIDESGEDLFGMFVEQNKQNHLDEVRDIVKRLRVIGYKEGARHEYFKHNEGKPGDGVCALFDMPGKNLRLYCIRYGCVAVLLGGGGFKPKSVRSYQQVPALNEQVEVIKRISQMIMNAQKEGDLKIDANGELIGRMIFNDEENEENE